MKFFLEFYLELGLHLKFWQTTFFVGQRGHEEVDGHNTWTG
jgi:hypothetical protein